MASPEERESILREVGSVFGEFQQSLTKLHDDYWNQLGDKATSLRLPSMEEVLGQRFTDFANIYSGFHGYLVMIHRVLEKRGEQLKFGEAIVNVKIVCSEWSDRLNNWKKRYA